MKHLVGGFGLGFMIGLMGFPAGDEKPFACTAVGVMAALAAWGLLP